MDAESNSHYYLFKGKNNWIENKWKNVIDNGIINKKSLGFGK